MTQFFQLHQQAEKRGDHKSNKLQPGYTRDHQSKNRARNSELVCVDLFENEAAHLFVFRIPIDFGSTLICSQKKLSKQLDERKLIHPTTSGFFALKFDVHVL